MSNRWSGFVVLGVLVLSSLASVVAAADPSARSPEALLDSETLAGRIDHYLAVRQTEKGVQPAPLADDAEFIRRLYLDLAGCIPVVTDVRDFLDDPRPDKRRLWVAMLLDGQKPSRKPNAFPQHFANVWRAWILSRVNNDRALDLARATEQWVQESLKENTSYDRLVRQMITTLSGNIYRSTDASPGVFYQANEFKPETLAASASRLFLGVKLECAQCHVDRSGGSWTQGQFWSFAAFFAGVDPRGGTPTDKREIAVPGKKQVVRARFLGGPEPLWKSGDDPRAVLADWLVSADNPYFTRAAVNRLWSYFFGTGLVDPMDEQGAHNPPSHPELLDELARQFAGHGFDLKYLIRALVASQAYQRISAGGYPTQDDPRLFARMPVRGLSAEQLFDSLAEATDYQDPSLDHDHYVVSDYYDLNGMNQSPRKQFLAQFSHQDKPTEPSTSILQALYFMNDSFVAERTSLEQNQTLALAEQKASDALRVETLFLVVLSRKPTAEESKRFIAFVERGGTGAGRREALADIFWALLNSPEFFLNH